MVKRKPEPKDLVIGAGIVIPHDKVMDTKRFILTQLRGGKSNVQIKQELIRSGWDEHAIDIIMYDVHIADNNTDKLERYVQACINKGLTLEQIKTTLLSIGWKKDVVDLVLEEFR